MKLHSFAQFFLKKSSGASGGPVWPPAATGEAIAAQGCLLLSDSAEFQRHEDLDLGCRAAVPWPYRNEIGDKWINDDNFPKFP